MNAGRTAQETAQWENKSPAVINNSKAKGNNAELINKLRSSIPQIAPMQPVAKITGNEFAKGPKSLVEQIGDFFKSIGNKVSRPGLGDVRLDERGVKDSIAHGIGRRKAAAFATVPQIIQFGQEIDAQSNWKGRGYDTRVFAAPISVGDNEVNYIAAIVTKGVDNRYYLHEVLNSDGDIIMSKNKEAGNVKTDLLFPNNAIGNRDQFALPKNSIGDPASINPNIPQSADGAILSICIRSRMIRT